jgi:hypothetical protein
MYPAPGTPQVLAVQPVLDAVGRDQAAPRLPFEQLKIGQILTGLVKSQSKGISLVEINGQTVAMRLPNPVATGDTLRLRFAGHMPQPVFLLETPETVVSDAPELSKTARMLSDIMQRVPERAPPTLTPPGPLLGQPSADPATMALALRTALVRSGLFYESHLANWVAGEDTLDGLMQEPQNRKTVEAARTSTSLALALADSQSAADQKPVNLSHTLLAQQLQVLESPHFIWRGELWPGQTLEWQLSQETDSAANNPTASPAHAEGAGWESHLKLTLPQLGALDVHIKLDAHQAFSIRVVPEQAATTPLLQNNQARLVAQLADAGCTLQSLTVQHDVDS